MAQAGEADDGADIGIAAGEGRDSAPRPKSSRRMRPPGSSSVLASAAGHRREEGDLAARAIEAAGLAWWLVDGGAHDRLVVLEGELIAFAAGLQPAH